MQKPSPKSFSLGILVRFALGFHIFTDPMGVRTKVLHGFQNLFNIAPDEQQMKSNTRKGTWKYENPPMIAK